MEYIKFNCYDLAEQNTELFSISSKLQSLYDEFVDVQNSIEQQIASYEGLNRLLSSSNAATQDIVSRVNAAYAALDRVIDIYYNAEDAGLNQLMVSFYL
jgi:septation ring formation regulator EzrA